MGNHRGAAPSSGRTPGAWASPRAHVAAAIAGCTGFAALEVSMSSPSSESAAFRSALDVVRSVEPGVADAITAELASQRASLKLIASENYASPAVLLAMGNWLSDKYAEGTIGRRFYAGCAQVDTIETIGAEHARELFGAPPAYVQPHSGIEANLVAYLPVLAHREQR